MNGGLISRWAGVYRCRQAGRQADSRLVAVLIDSSFSLSG